MIINDVATECSRQHKLWGEQNRSPFEWLAILTEEVGEVARALCNVLTAVNRQAKLEAYVNLREELIQVASVAVSFVESLDRNELKKVSGKRFSMRNLAK
jgi:NTP pyrophosphatase (non-canonical NTP hydrolase)